MKNLHYSEQMTSEMTVYHVNKVSQKETGNEKKKRQK